MAHELGMNPKKFGKIDNHKQEPWKAPLPDFIADIYYKRFGRECPATVLPIEDIFRLKAEKKDAKRQAKRERKAAREAAAAEAPAANTPETSPSPEEQLPS